MNIFQIALRSIRQRGLASFLTMFSMALGVMLVVAVLSIHGVVTKQFRNNASLGYNLLVGATKGGRLQLTLNSVFYLSQPVENIDYKYYLEFVEEAERLRSYQHSIAAHQALNGEQLTADNIQERLGVESAGRFTESVAYAIPLGLGDYFGRFRVVATTSDFFNRLEINPETGAGLPFEGGRAFEYWNEDHGFFEAVVGATVAKEKNIKVGDRISPAHGDPEGKMHARNFHVSGVLAPTGTPNDRAVFVNMEGFYHMEGHSKPLSDEDLQSDGDQEEPVDPFAEEVGDEPDAHFRLRRPLALEKREVTAVLVRTVNAFVGPNLMNMINEGKEAQCAQPVRQIYSLLEVFVRPIQWVLLILTVMICLVSGISILVSIYNSMSDRRHEISVMRALGASRNAVMGIVLAEAVLLSVGGGLAGWVLGHGLNVAASDLVEERTGVRMGFFDFAPPVDLSGLLGADESIALLNVSPEVLLIPALILLAIIVGFLPAISAYSTNVAKWLGK